MTTDYATRDRKLAYDRRFGRAQTKLARLYLNEYKALFAFEQRPGEFNHHQNARKRALGALTRRYSEDFTRLMKEDSK